MSPRPCDRREPFQGTLLESTNATGPWVTNTATSPFTNAITGTRKFYRVRVK